MDKTILALFMGLCYNLSVAAENQKDNEIEGAYGHSIYLNSKSPASAIFDEVDILKLANVSAKDQGVSLVEGPISKYPAYKFRLPYGNVALPNSTVIINAMNKHSSFTVLFLYRQQKNNLGRLLSVNSPGRLTPWFLLTSNSRSGTLTLNYRVGQSAKLNQAEWKLPIHHNKKLPTAAWTWLSVVVDCTSGIVRLDLDCLPSRFESFTSGNYQTCITIPHDSLVYFRQEPGRKKKFLGELMDKQLLLKSLSKLKGAGQLGYQLHSNNTLCP